MTRKKKINDSYSILKEILLEDDDKNDNNREDLLNFIKEKVEELEIKDEDLNEILNFFTQMLPKQKHFDMFDDFIEKIIAYDFE
jgi:hypothetical protein